MSIQTPRGVTVDWPLQSTFYIIALGLYLDEQIVSILTLRIQCFDFILKAYSYKLNTYCVRHRTILSITNRTIVPCLKVTVSALKVYKTKNADNQVLILKLCLIKKRLKSLTLSLYVTKQTILITTQVLESNSCRQTSS